MNCIKPSRILLTGGTGFVGQQVLRHFPNAVILTRQCGIRQPCIVGDMRTVSFIGGFNYLIHAAGHRKHVGKIQEDLDGADNIVRVARRSGVRKMLLASSGGAYGDCEYGKAKREIEWVFLSSGIPCVVARLFTFLDPLLLTDLHFAASCFIADAKAGRTITVQNPNVVRSFMGGHDLGRWLSAIFHRGEWGHVYDVGSTEAVTLLDLAERIGHRYGVGVENAGGMDRGSYLPTIGRTMGLRSASLDTLLGGL